MFHRITIFKTDWGWLGLAASERGVIKLTLPQPSLAAAWERLENAVPEGVPVSPETFQPVVDQLQRYFHGEAVEFDVPLDLSAHTPFLREVWEATHTIPYGETRSYAELAATVGRPRAYRAVGRAMALNPVPIIIPCHRVIGSNGGLHGYGGGLDLKRRLLDMERRNTVASV